MPVSQAYTFKVINFGDTAQEYIFGLASAPATPRPRPVAPPRGAAGDCDELGAQLVTRFFDALKSGDKERWRAMLAPAFQLVRSNGEVFDAASYPDNLPALEAYALSDLHATRRRRRGRHLHHARPTRPWTAAKRTWAHRPRA